MPEQSRPSDGNDGRLDTRLALALATLLITNSHLEAFYPIPQLAGDGLLGNGLFFAVAGLGVARSARRTRRPFLEYYWRRIKRIYPTVIVVVTAWVIIGSKWSEWRPLDYFAAYVYPTPWPFIAYVMVYYAVFYPFLRYPARAVWIGLFAGAIAAFVWFWIQYPQPPPRLRLGELHPGIYWAFDFGTVVLGCALAFAPPGRARLPLLLCVLSMLFALYVAAKYLFVTGRVSSWHFTVFILSISIVWVLLRIAQTPSVLAFVAARPWLRWVVEWLSRHTLEIYTLQFFFVYREELSHGFPFPLNIAMFWIVLLPVAWITGRAASLFRGEEQGSPITS